MWKPSKQTNNLPTLDTVLCVESLITLQAVCKPVTHTYDGCMPHCISERDELFTQTQAHTRIPMSNQCA